MSSFSHRTFYGMNNLFCSSFFLYVLVFNWSGNLKRGNNARARCFRGKSGAEELAAICLKNRRPSVCPSVRRRFAESFQRDLV